MRALLKLKLINLLPIIDLSNDDDDGLNILSSNEFAKLLQNEPLNQLFRNKLIPIDWDLGSYETVEDINYITKKNQTVMIDEKLTSLSILTHPYKVPAGWRLCLDYFGTDTKLMKTHVIQQFRKLQDFHKSCTEEDLHIFVNFEPTLESTFGEIAKSLKIEKLRKNVEMSIFEKKIR